MMPCPNVVSPEGLRPIITVNHLRLEAYLCGISTSLYSGGVSRSVQNLLDKFKDGSSNGRGTFKFPPPPAIHEPRLSPVCSSDTSDSQAESLRGKKTSKRGCRMESESERLPPIGVFWDIENCQIPHGKSALTIVQAIRNTFFDDYREAEFTVVCDVHKESPTIIQELNDAQVDLLHVISSSKNAADEKLRQAIRRFADLHGTPSAVVLISSDINFAPDLSDLRHRKKIHVILLHATSCSESLIMCANEHYNFGDFVQPLPSRNSQVVESQSADIFIWNLPMTQGDQKIKWRLKSLSQNCGGRIIVISRPMAVLRFPTLEMAVRAQKRMDGELVFGQPIRVGVSHFMNPPVNFDNQYGNRLRSDSLSGGQSYRESNHSSFLPINPNPWIGQNQNGFNHSLSELFNKSSKPDGDVATNGGPSTSTGHFTSPWAWPLKEENKVETPRNAQNFLNGFGKLSIYDGNTTQTFANKENQDRFPANGPPGLQKGWSNTPTFTTAFVDPRDWTDSSKKQRRVSPVPNMQQPRTPLDSVWNSGKTPSAPRTRKSRTPSPYAMLNSQMAHPRAVKPSMQNSSTATLSADVDDKDKYFSPISPSSNGGIELHVSNLDQNVDPKEMKQKLTNLLRQYVTRPPSVSIIVQPDQTYAASVKVSSLQDAQLIISRLHRRKLESRKMIISHARPNQQNNFSYLKSQTIALLQDVPQHSLLLFKFLEMFEARYVTPISISDLFKLKDVCTITDECSGRMVSLNAEYRDAQSPAPSQQEVQPYCAKHYLLFKSAGKGWAEQEAPSLPNIMVPLDVFSANIKQLLGSHGNALPLTSLGDCYNSECEPLPVHEDGVPLEHYVTCISQVELVVSNSGIKYLRPCDFKNVSELKNVTTEKYEEYPTCVSPSLVVILHQFEREVIDLLKTQPHCQLLFNKFIPAYHHHFGRQCRVADYGFTKLIDLLEAVSHVAQVMGEGNKRMVTLSHRVQIRRFTSDVFRALKSQPMKEMRLFELPAVFERVLGRPFDPIDYGLCTLKDLVEHLSDCSVLVHRDGVLYIPKKEQSDVEVKRTRQFAQEVVELLSEVPKFSLHFERFIPAYHHHFTQQCKVADFGFAKLIELFEAIPDTVKLEEDSEGRKISLTFEKKLQVLSEQMIDLVYHLWPPGLHLNNVEDRYLWRYGYVLNPSSFNAANLEDLLNQLDSVKVVSNEHGKIVMPLDGALLKQVASKVRAFLLNSDHGRMPLAKLRSHFSVYHEPFLTPQKLVENIPDVVQLVEEDGVIIVELTPPYRFVSQLVELLTKSEGRMSLTGLEGAYVAQHKRSTTKETSSFGFSTLEDFLSEHPLVFVLRGKGSRRQVLLNKDIRSFSKPMNNNLYSGLAICRPHPANDCDSSASDTSNNASLNEQLGRRSISPLTSLLRMPDPVMNGDISTPLLPCSSSPYTMPPDPSQLPQPGKNLGIREEKENEGDSFSLFANNSLSSTTPSSLLSSGSKRKPRRIAAHFDQPLED